VRQGVSLLTNTSQHQLVPAGSQSLASNKRQRRRSARRLRPVLTSIRFTNCRLRNLPGPTTVSSRCAGDSPGSSCAMMRGPSCCVTHQITLLADSRPLCAVVRWLSRLGREPTAWRRGLDGHRTTVVHTLRPAKSTVQRGQRRSKRTELRKRT
jgi:hypothetical protein